ncbi:MAG: tRNA (adenosine(37)-N6)-threonylcarbamoyltransferase complex dimerization subunit type 1 TsaB [Chlorobiaceae bacterium]|jgi:tRNA threonylcarbamoyladenosine biosynthesis protein TsaB|nr:tRNA (adenosine(37)-N6)-threonylcarbamoyltransferase complex dimerization subunit type 1 TsaB [Chlorobiaceae bacterium]
MNILAIECTHASISAALLTAGDVYEAQSTDWQKAAETLVPLIGEVHESAGLERSALDCIAFSSGPGSFTALRIGISIAKGIAWGIGVPLVAVPTMPAIAAALDEPLLPVMTIIRSRKGEYYFACYTREELSSGQWHDRVERGDAGDLVAAASLMPDGVVAAGRGLDELQPFFAASGIRFAGADFFSARSLFPFAERLCPESDFAGLNDVAPDYRQMFVPKVRGG